MPFAVDCGPSTVDIYYLTPLKTYCYEAPDC